VGAEASMEFESILVSKALPDGTYSQKLLLMPHRTITSSNDLRDFTAGTIRSSKGKFDACVYTRESVCRASGGRFRVSDVGSPDCSAQIIVGHKEVSL